jgi:hypothetical protein
MAVLQAPWYDKAVEALKLNGKVVYGTHPIPQKYLNMHDQLGTWDDHKWQEII